MRVNDNLVVTEGSGYELGSAARKENTSHCELLQETR